MKRVFISIIIFMVFALAFNTSLSAECDDTDLNNWAEKLEIKIQEVENEEYPYSYLLMLNIPRNDLRVTAKDSFSSGTYNVDYDAEFKNYVVGSEIHFVDKTYTFTIYMADSSSVCGEEKMKTITYTVPKYNEYNDTEYCEENPNAEICGSYTKIDENKEDELDKLIDRYYKDKLEDEIYRNAPWYQKVWMVVKDYSLYVVIPLAAVASVYTVVIYITKKRREKE